MEPSTSTSPGVADGAEHAGGVSASERQQRLSNLRGWLSRVRIPRMTHAEYRANLSGLNIFFGAVLGFVLAGMESLKPFQFGLLLTMVSGIVIGILYVSSSRHRLAYTAVTALLILELPRWLHFVVQSGEQIPQNLQPTLAVWLGMTAFVEFLPREPDRLGPGAGVQPAAPHPGEQ
jgi:hypothetical protein